MNWLLIWLLTGGDGYNITSFPWTVTTSKDLTTSNMFFMSLYKTGATSPDDWTVYFNISSPSSGVSTSTTLTSATTSSASSTTSPTSETTSPARETTSASSSNTGASQGGFDTGAKVGIGIGIPVAAVLGIAAGWLIFRKRKSPGGSTDHPPQENKHASDLPPYVSGTQDPPHFGGQPTYFEASGEPRTSAAAVELDGR